MVKSSRKRPRDPNQLAKLIVDISIGDVEDAAVTNETETAVQGRAGGLSGGKARAKKLTAEQRAEIAHIAATARWKKSES